MTWKTCILAATVVLMMVASTGCLNEAMVDVTDVSATKNVWGDAVVLVTAKNNGPMEASGTMYAEVEINGVTYTGSEYVSMQSGETRTFEVYVDLPASTYFTGGSARAWFSG